MSNLIDLTGKTVGDWSVLSRGPDTSRGATTWRCRCSCGVIKLVQATNLNHGKSTQCKRCARLGDGQASFNSLFHSYQVGAKERRLKFDLSADAFRRLTSDVCHYCGEAPKQVWSRGLTFGHYTYNGIDRKDNKLGYTEENCVSCCGACNRRKRAVDYEEFIQWVKRVAIWLNR